MTSVITPLLGYTSYLALLVRLFLGISLVIHGYPKIKGGWRQSGEWMNSMGIPATTAIFAIIIEFFGGLLLLVGFIVPVVSVFVVLEFASIIGMKRSKMKARYITMTADKPSYEIDAFYLVMGVVLLVLGGGALSIDSVLF